MIILDFETNSGSVGDVIEIAAAKVKLEDGELKVIDLFHRYYLSRYPVNFHSYKVHRLTPELILDYRQDKDYSSYFSEDLDFEEFCKGCETLVAHNISFELRHINKRVYFPKHICTMKENKHLVEARGSSGRIKNPKLNEVCAFYGIEFDENKHHSATYDVTKTYEILKNMRIDF